LGSDTARFSHFLKGPRAIVAYLSKGRDGASAGHNPLGGWSVLALLLLLIVQATLGLFAIDVDGIEAGPLSAFVDFDTARWAAKTHHLVFNVMAGLIALHLAAIAFYALFRRENLIGPMFTGRKALAEGQTPPRMGNLWLALALAVAVGVLVFAASQAFWAL
jgi:cytochrome b